MFFLDYPFGTCSLEHFKPLSRKYMCLEIVVDMNNKLNAPLNLQENLTLKYAILGRYAHFKIVKLFEGRLACILILLSWA